MIKISDYDVWNVEIEAYDIREIGRFFLDGHMQDRVVVTRNGKPIKIVTSLDIANQRIVNEDVLVHNKNVFEQARKIFLSYGEDREGRCIPVINSSEELEYILTYSYNRDIRLDKWDYVREFDEYDTMSEEVDIELLERADAYIIEEFNEYTDAIIRVIRRFWKDKKIITVDKRARYFWKDIIIYDSFEQLYYNMGNEQIPANRVMFINKDCSERQKYLGMKDRQIVKFLTLQYNYLEVMTSLFWKSDIKAYGEKNAKDTILLIKYPIETDGLGCVISATTDIMKMALDKKMIPVVDLSIPEKANQFTGGKEENMWEYYFRQCKDVTVEEAYQSKRVVIWNNIFDKYNPYLQEAVTFKRNEAMKECLCLRAETLRFCEEQRKEIVPEDGKVLGVIARGTDYRTICNFQIDIDTFIKKVIEKMTLWNCKYLFLATEDQEIFEKFEEVRLGEKLLFSKQKRYDYRKAENKYCLLGNIKDTGCIEGMKYFSILYILSKCSSFITNVKCGASLVVKGLNSQFENEWIYDDEFRM